MGTPDENGLNWPSLSPDGRRAAVWRAVQGNSDIWLVDDSRSIRFTFDAANDRWPIWSRDGSWIVFQSRRNDRENLYRKAASGIGRQELLADSPEGKVATDWSADGQFISYLSLNPETEMDIWILPMLGERKPWLFLRTKADERQAQFSPDGHWVAYMSDESGQREIYIRPFAAPKSADQPVNSAGGQWQVSTSGGIYPRWRRDGKELYYIGPHGEMMSVPITATGTTLEPGAPVALFPTRILGGGVDNQQGRQYDISRDGRFLINTVLDDTSSPITLIQNWNAPAR